MNKIKACSRACAVLLALLVLCQFLPYWHVAGENGGSVSICDLTWFPHLYPELKAHLSTLVEGFPVNGVAYLSVLLMVLSGVGIFLCLRKGGSSPSVLPVIIGVAGAAGYLCQPTMMAGTYWALHLALLVLVAVTGLCAVLLSRRDQHA